ncbi:penicillin-insensitive murein endopeptidase [Oceaniradius stylonematis]|uniref:penicillin-insensitive murein endopeptidase n=1 Tax=Oceaniradius stylonematis TaxID=2184161 RepID=UPI00273FBA7A|nr:penicillin-insensitive murein endopeptidase [Oceaniradius stylonematis]
MGVFARFSMRARFKPALTGLAVVGLALMCGLGSTPALAEEPAKQLFGNTPLPAATEARVHGFYSSGCIAGAVAMPIDGPNWQAMRLERNRRWGHPDLIALVQRLSREAAADGWPGLLVGDISQPRGGPMLSGHASHQVGLDADIWLTKMPNRRLTQSERANTSAVSVLKQGTIHVDPAIWTAEHAKLLRRAASYGAVERLFVHPGIKRAMCDAYGADRGNDRWMIKIRPYYGHHYHFHIRMKCPADSPNCRPQDPVPASGNGCDASLDWWFTSEPWTPKPQAPGTKPRPRREKTLADLPNACRGVLRAPRPASESLATYSASFDQVAMIASAVPIADAAPARAALPGLARLPIPADRPRQ